MKPLAGHRIVSSISFLLLLATFILLLLVGLSLPILKSVYLLSVKSITSNQPQSSIATQLKFGVWGFCASSEIGQSTICYGPQLGYDIPSNITDFVGISPTVVDAVEKSLLAILILHLVAAGLAFFGYILSLFLESQSAAIVTLIIAIVTAIVASIVFAIDLALVIVARDKIDDLPNFRLQVDWGNGVWMVLVAVVTTWLAVITLSARVCYCCGVRRKQSY